MTRRHWNFYVNWYEWWVGYTYDKPQRWHVIHLIPVVGFAISTPNQDPNHG